MIAAFGAMLGFASCTNSADEHPILDPVKEGTVENYLNTPEMANMALQITESGKKGYVHMTCSQPKAYGFAAPVVYTVEASMNSDFKTPIAADLPAYIDLETTFSNCEGINPTFEEIARAMCTMLGIDSEDQVPSPYYPLYLRLVANMGTVIAGVTSPNTTVTSNVVCLNEVSVGYLAIVKPDQRTGYFMRGVGGNWDAQPDWEFLTTSEANVYVLKNVTIAKGDNFKVADASWGDVNCGAGSGTLEIGKKYTLNNSGSSGNIEMPVDFTGRVTLYQSGSSFSILFEKPAE